MYCSAMEGGEAMDSKSWDMLTWLPKLLLEAARAAWAALRRRARR